MALTQVRYLSICDSILHGYHLSSLLSYASNSIVFDIVSTEHASMYIDERLMVTGSHMHVKRRKFSESSWAA